jgi:hypothetical protein
VVASDSSDDTVVASMDWEEISRWIDGSILASMNFIEAL